jgi:hypothetical protein
MAGDCKKVVLSVAVKIAVAIASHLKYNCYISGGCDFRRRILRNIIILHFGPRADVPEQRRQKANDAVRRQQIHDEIARRAVDVGEAEIDENRSVLDHLEQETEMEEVGSEERKRGKKRG